MNRWRKKYLIYIIPIGSLIVFAVMYFKMFDTVENLAKSLLEEKMEQSKTQLDKFFEPVESSVNIARDQAMHGDFDSLNLYELNEFFYPLIHESDAISSMMVANDDGNEYMLLDMGGFIVNRWTRNVGGSLSSTRFEWSPSDTGFSLNKQWPEEKDYDPRTRPWYMGAIDRNDEQNWTAPYTFFTTKDPGITVSKKWTDPTGTDHVIAFDVLLMDVSRFTNEFEITKNGSVFILTEDNLVLGVPREVDSDNIAERVLKPIDSFDQLPLTTAHKAWKESDADDEYFSFDPDGMTWWCSIEPYRLGNQTLYIGLAAPEEDFMADVANTQWLILGGMALVLFFTVISKELVKRSRMIPSTESMIGAAARPIRSN